MKPHSYTSEGIVLGRKNYGEADRILVIYSKHFGKIFLLAKGVRRPTSRKRGHIELFNLVRFQASGGRSMDIMTEAEVIDSFNKVKKNLNKVSLAYYFMEVVGRATHENEVHKAVFDLLLNFLNRLKTETKLKSLRLDFILRLLIVLGFWPEGKKLTNPDEKLKEVLERNLFSERVGKDLTN